MFWSCRLLRVLNLPTSSKCLRSLYYMLIHRKWVEVTLVSRQCRYLRNGPREGCQYPSQKVYTIKRHNELSYKRRIKKTIYTNTDTSYLKNPDRSISPRWIRLLEWAWKPTIENVQTYVRTQPLAQWHTSVMMRNLNKTINPLCKKDMKPSNQ